MFGRHVYSLNSFLRLFLFELFGKEHFYNGKFIKNNKSFHAILKYYKVSVVLGLPKPPKTICARLSEVGNPMLGDHFALC